MDVVSTRDLRTARRNPSDEELSALFRQFGLVAKSRAMMPVLLQAWKASNVGDAALLIDGETGTGKQVLAEAIHHLDEKRSRYPFVTAHCGTIQENLAESELFGHHRGAFSGAVGDRKGLFQTAHQGTLFLDDVNDLPLSLQPKLLDVLQRGIIRAVGADREKCLDVRVIAACNRPLKPLVAQNQFRADLYYRLDVIHVTLPALRRRLDDLPHLMLAMAHRHADLYGPIHSVDAELLEYLAAQPFPGNIRELEHAVERMLFQKSSGDSLTRADWTAQEQDAGELDVNATLRDAAATLWERIKVRGDSYTQVLNELEKQLLEAAIAAQGRTRRELAAVLRISERKLYQRIREFRLSEPMAAAANSGSKPAASNSVRQRLSPTV
ncbi:MAG: sigma 54-interacting transcriptional regulator [Bryobacteraceae bacterium]